MVGKIHKFRLSIGDGGRGHEGIEQIAMGKNSEIPDKRDEKTRRLIFCGLPLAVWPPKGASLDLFFFFPPLHSLSPTNVRGGLIPLYTVDGGGGGGGGGRLTLLYCSIYDSITYYIIYRYIEGRRLKRQKKKKKKDGVFNAQPRWGALGGEIQFLPHTVVVWSRLARGFSYSHKTLFITF